MYTAIIADDEPWIAYGIANLINWEAFGFKIVDTALDGLSALEKVKHHMPDLLISDIRMPGLSGLELMRCLRDTGIDTEVVFMSGYTEFEYAQEAVRLGAFDYLVKQVENTDLESMLTRMAAKLSGKRSNDWDTYFRLFDESGCLTAFDCARILGLAHDAAACFFVTLLFDTPVDKPLILRLQIGMDFMLSFRTGTCKLGLLAFGQDKNHIVGTIRDRFANTAAAGVSDVSDGGDSFYLLYRQSDIAAGVARDRTVQRVLDYQEAKHIMETVSSHKPMVAEEDKLPSSPSQAKAIIDELESSFTRELHITDLARSFYISPNYLCTLIKRETGMTYSDFIITKRIQLAKRLLRETDLSIQEIIDQIGYRDYAHFSKLFKRREGITPTKYRNIY